MKRLLFAVFLLISYGLSAQTPANVNPEKILLPNGWGLTPVGNFLPLGDLPLNLVLSPNGKYAAVTNNGQSIQSIQLLSTVSQQLLHTVAVPKSWYGLQFSYDSKWLYASAGHDNLILRYAISGDTLRLKDSLVLGKPWPQKIGPAGLVLHKKKTLLYTVTREDSALYVMDYETKKLVHKQSIGAEGYGCVLSPDQSRLYISVWGGDHVKVLSTENYKLLANIPVGDNPNEMAITKDGRYLYVCNANDNSVSVIDTRNYEVIETLNTALYPESPSGSTANALCMDSKEQTLYVANADNNCLTVFDIRKKGFSESKGFIPTGWYPTNVKLVGKNLWIANGKGFSSQANPKGPNPLRPRSSTIRHLGDTSKVRSEQYIGGLFWGTLGIVPTPSATELASYSKLVYENTPFNPAKQNAEAAKNAAPFALGKASPIKYVFYIIKENRTYDQVLGDLPQGNGDTSLVLFGRHITPNLHKLAEEFVLLDNFYTNGEVSADGHNWTMGAYATDYLEKTWPTSYGGRGGTYGGEGERKVANNKGGFFWDLCSRSGVSFRTYGEFADDGKPTIPVLEGHTARYTGYNTDIKDTVRFYQWKRDFDSLVAINQVPQFNSVRFGNDHTDGLRKGRPTPYAHVADNDLAVGMFIEYLSQSPIWKESAVFIVEDDAQNGPDHVDAHRTTAYVAGPHFKRGYVDHTMYSTSSMLRTMEMILGLPPMTQYDAAATPMWNSFTSNPDFTSFVSLPSNINLNDRNTAMNKWQQLSETFDLSKEDAAPDLEFSKVIWHAVKGLHVPFPAPRRAAFIKVHEEKEEDDD
jgi:YVTN family beta-propeller protein